MTPTGCSSRFCHASTSKVDFVDGVDAHQMIAVGVLAPIPACIFFAFIQRYLVQNLTAGALKG